MVYMIPLYNADQTGNPYYKSFRSAVIVLSETGWNWDLTIKNFDKKSI